MTSKKYHNRVFLENMCLYGVQPPYAGLSGRYRFTLVRPSLSCSSSSLLFPALEPCLSVVLDGFSVTVIQGFSVYLDLGAQQLLKRKVNFCPLFSAAACRGTRLYVFTEIQMENMSLAMNSVQLHDWFLSQIGLLRSSGAQRDGEVRTFYSSIMTKSNPCARLQHLGVIRICEPATWSQSWELAASLKSDNSVSSCTAFDWWWGPEETTSAEKNWFSWVLWVYRRQR